MFECDFYDIPLLPVNIQRIRKFDMSKINLKSEGQGYLESFSLCRYVSISNEISSNLLGTPFLF